jgi:L,D-transpeptidase ErfK/SrfK
MLSRVSTALLYMWALQSASAATFVPAGDVIGSVEHYRVTEKDNLYEIARQYDIGIVELLAANPGIDPWIPESGTELTITSMHVLPATPRKGIVINLSELRLFYYAEDGSVTTFPIGIGREGWRTPIGKTKVLRKRKNPLWTPPPSIREEEPDLPEVILPGPDNPLGEYALDLGIHGVLIHGTNRPYGVGKRSSHGCIRLYPEDIKALFNTTSVGIPVTIIDMPYKLGWRDDTLFLEVTPTQEQSDVIAEYGKPVPISIPEVYEKVRKMAGENTEINWYAVEETLKQNSGIPVAIASRYLY